MTIGTLPNDRIYWSGKANAHTSPVFGHNCDCDFHGLMLKNNWTKIQTSLLSRRGLVFKGSCPFPHQYQVLGMYLSSVHLRSDFTLEQLSDSDQHTFTFSLPLTLKMQRYLQQQQSALTPDKLANRRTAKHALKLGAKTKLPPKKVLFKQTIVKGVSKKLCMVNFSPLE